MKFTRYLECEHCGYTRDSESDGRQFDEMDPAGPLGRAGDPKLVCQTCIEMHLHQCDCCLRYSVQPPRFTTKDGVEHCEDCHDSECHQSGQCLRPAAPGLYVPVEPGKPVPSMVTDMGRVLRYKRDKFGNVIQQPAFERAPRPGSDAGPTEEELRATYKSLGYEYDMNTKPEEGS